jgi:hypothetical protein
VKKRLIATLSTLGLIAIIGASGVSASIATWEFVAGNPPCEEGTKIEPVAPGWYPLPDGGQIRITIHDTAAGQTFDFLTSPSANFYVSSVIVKGGPNALLWTFEPPDNEGYGLHAPVNPKNEKYYGLSHLCFDSFKKTTDNQK